VGKAEILDKGPNPRFVVANLPAEGFAGEPEERFAARALYEKLYCARGEMENRIKEAQQNPLCRSHQHGLDRPSRSHALGAAGRGVARHRSGCGHPAPRSGSNSSRSVPASRSADQLPAHPSGVSQRLPLPENFPARLCKCPNAAGLKFKELLLTQENELASANVGPCSQTLIVEARNTPGPTLRHQPGRISSKVRFLHAITTLKSKSLQLPERNRV
jgi:hypothetical protein